MRLAILLAVLRFLGVHRTGEAIEVTNAIVEESQKAHTPIDPLLVAAIVGHESRYHMRAISADGHDVGLMQLRRGASTFMSVPALQNPRTNVHLGIDVLQLYIAQCGTLPKALAAYNTGRCSPKGRVVKRARAYVRAVLRSYEALKEEVSEIETPPLFPDEDEPDAG